VAQGTPEPLRSQLASALGEDGILTRAIDLIKYASDASPYRRIPRAVALPRNTTDVVALLAAARRHGFPITFRAGGTSLNGQAQSDSVLVDVRRHWQRAQVLDGGARVRVAPGMVLGRVNRLLARHGRKLGPDPASTDIACIGGVLANNSGGMRCGVHADPYSTVQALEFVLANGRVIDTAAPDAAERFADAAPELATGLAELRDELRADPELSERVRRKFAIKNTTGYRLCALLDADEPVEIFKRLLVGSEGTLAFIAGAELRTVPLGRHAELALVVFDGVDSATAAVPGLVAAGASATELMVAPTLIAAAWNMPGTPVEWKELPPSAAALLIEFRHDDPAELRAGVERGLEALAGSGSLAPPEFSGAPERAEVLWRVREGMQGLLAAMRAPGVQLILEDVCFPPERLAEGARELQALLGEHGFLPGVAGHASAGNLHFVLTPNFGQAGELERYDAFMQELVELVVGRFDGSLKAEHGTGVNMAPFVEREWGAKATEMMWRIKRLADPEDLLNPGAVLNRDPQIHLRHLKGTPEVEAEVTKCIECGFCEPVCPSRNVTTTPRQRIVIRREMARQPAGSPVLRALNEQYGYEAVDTCAADGSCMHACPVSIDTGKLIKALRRRHVRPRAAGLAVGAVARYELIERLGRLGAAVGARPAGLTGRSIPPAAPPLPATPRDGAAAVYLPACINRIFGNPTELSGHPSLPEALVTLSERAGRPVWIPPDAAGHCCGTPWSSKGYAAGHTAMAERTRESLRRWSEGGRLPVVIDASSCAHGLTAEVGVEGVDVLDAVAWVHDQLLERLVVQRRLATVALHHTCAGQHLGLAGRLGAIAAAIADEVVIPVDAGCCGMAGDRGWLHPELTASALRDTATELSGRRFDACLSSNRTCEAALAQVTGHPYASFVLALEEVTRP
jgi:D-lactate dehydrogenase